ncbi:hypothetical protein RRG08_049180 [Elysia crispata]|uniref:Uncharacterized protein n=1 Tax=Elysia crispata TaxID=231223 RepID=A0AAE1E337_9GAST|nr:hypothetical protein RRG08_049180 [Elysia crispata]
MIITRTDHVTLDTANSFLWSEPGVTSSVRLTATDCSLSSDENFSILRALLLEALVKLKCCIMLQPALLLRSGHRHPRVLLSLEKLGSPSITACRPSVIHYALSSSVVRALVSQSGRLRLSLVAAEKDGKMSETRFQLANSFLIVNVSLKHPNIAARNSTTISYIAGGFPL